MNAIFRCFVTLLAAGLAAGSASAQSSVRIDPATGKLGWLTRPYQQRYIPPINLANSSRFDSLIHAGNLYVSAQDVIALALENNIDIEIARYNPSLMAWNLERSLAGGALPGVPSGASQSASIANGQGVLGSQQAAGVSLPGARGGSR
jgi:outer membrane protein